MKKQEKAARYAAFFQGHEAAAEGGQNPDGTAAPAKPVTESWYRPEFV